MSVEPNEIQALQRAILDDAQAEARQILTRAHDQAERIRQAAEAKSQATRAPLLQRAQREAEAVRSQAAASAQLESQSLVLRRREQLLARVFDAARQQLPFLVQRPDYPQVARDLVREAMEHLGGDAALVRADPRTQESLGDDVLAELAQELDVQLQTGPALDQGIGVVLETPDGHRQHDNRFEARLTRLQDELRAPVYHVLMGEQP